MGILVRAGSYLWQLSRFIGPGFMIAVGYLDPGNWATDMEGGSQFGYRLLFIVLLSNIIAVFLQNLTIRLGTVTGLDLASISRRYFPRYLNLLLYVLAEIAIIATDLAEGIGSAIALNLLFPRLPLPAGVAITAVDVFIILLFYNEDATDSDASSADGTASMRLVRCFEIFVMMLVAAVGICLTIILAYSDVRAVDVLKGYVPSKEIFSDPQCLYVAIGMIGATVMPHNLYLHSFIVQARCREWRSHRPQVTQVETGEEERTAWKIKKAVASEKTTTEKRQATVVVKELVDTERLRTFLNSAVRINLHYGFIDLLVALIFAFYVNSVILVVAGANFYYGSASQRQQVQDLFSAHDLLAQYLGPAAGVVFALALLCSGQSSTITATLAGQVVMAGFLGMTTRPWIRRIVTRLVAIVPALVVACVAGRSGLSNLLVASQVALSIQLPFAVVPLVIFTSWKNVMKLELVVESRENQSTNSCRSIPWLDRIFPRIPSVNFIEFCKMALGLVPRKPSMSEETESNTASVISDNSVLLSEWPEPIFYPNGWVTMIVAFVIALLLLGLNIYLVVSLAMGQG